MSPHSSSYDLSQRKNMSKTEETVTTTGASKPHTKSCDIVTLSEDSSEPMLSNGHHASAKKSTIVLYQGDNDKPAITLTTYSDDMPVRQFKVRLVEPTNLGDDHILPISLDEAFAETSALTDQKSKDLVHELEQYFEELKSEFEQKTGKVWEPLRAWSKEEWDWTNDEAEAEDLILVM